MSCALALVLALATLTPAQEAEARRLEAELIAPCCWSQQVSVHQSAAAAEIKRDIRERLAVGATKREILDAYVAQYGPAILTEPPAKGWNWLLYLLPPAVFVASGFLLVVLVRRLTAKVPAADPEPRTEGTTESPADEDRVDDELCRLD